MESLTSRQAADNLGVNPQKFHRLVATYQVEPLLKAKGIRGVRFWHPLDIEALRRRIEADEVAS